MITKGLWVYLKAKAGKEPEIEKLLKEGGDIVRMGEPATESWFAIKLGPRTYGILDTFADDSGRNAHLAGRVAESLKNNAAALFDNEPSLEKCDVIAAKT
jgi:hypothetical protein